jgi:hypothetical protein
MLKRYVGQPIDTFMTQEGFAYEAMSPLRNGGAVYRFSGGPGGQRCVFYVSTSPAGTITTYRFENC